MKLSFTSFRSGWQLPVLLGALVLIGGVRSANASMVAPGSEPSGHSYYAPGTPISDDFVLGPTAPGKWGSPVFGTGAVVTYSFMPSGSAMEPGEGLSVALSSFMPVGFEAAIEAAFAAWSAVADITFVEVADDGAAWNAATTSGDIRIAGSFLGGAGGTLAHGYFPPANGLSAAGDIHFDTADTWKIGFGGPGFDIFQVMAHEIGHAIGLDHTGVPASLMNPFYTEAFAGLQADDIAGAVFIYGAAPVDPPVVPEPGSIALLLSGVLALGARRWRKTVQQAA